MGGRLNVGRQIAVVAVLLEDLGDLIGTNAVADGKAYSNWLRIARRAGSILNVRLLRSNRKERQLLPMPPYSHTLWVFLHNLAELGDDTSAPRRNRIERPYHYQQDQDTNRNRRIADDRRSTHAIGRRISSRNVHSFPLVV